MFHSVNQARPQSLLKENPAIVYKEFTIKVLTNRSDGCIVLNVVSTQGKRVLTVLKAVRLWNSVREKKKYLLLLSNTI